MMTGKKILERSTLENLRENMIDNLTLVNNIPWRRIFYPLPKGIPLDGRIWEASRICIMRIRR